MPKRYVAEYEAFQYDELSEKAKEKALEDNYEINIDEGWWEDDTIPESYQEVGISYKDFYFDLGRSQIFYLDKPVIDDPVKFGKAAGLTAKDLRYLKDESVIPSIGTKRYGGGDAVNYVNVEEITATPRPILDSIENKLNEFLKKKNKETYNSLQKRYDSLTTREAIEDSLRELEYEFNADGTRFTMGRAKSVQSLKHGGIVQRTGYAKLHAGELVVPAKTLKQLKQTKPHYEPVRRRRHFVPDMGQGGWFRESMRHRAARYKGLRRR